MKPTSLTLTTIKKAIETSYQEMATEVMTVRVGKKDRQELAPIVAKYVWLYDLKTISWIAKRRDQVQGELRERLSRIYFFLCGGYLDRQVVKLDDQITTAKAQAELTVDGEEFAYHDLRAKLRQEEDYARRERLDDAGLEVVRKLNPLRLEALNKVDDHLKKDLGYGDYESFYRQKKTVDYDQLAKILTQSLARTTTLYERAMGEWVEKRLGQKLGQIRVAHLSYLLGNLTYDRLFPKEKMAAILRLTLGELGFDLENQPNIIIDLADRPRKNPRACVIAVRVPEEIYLIVKPIGGLDDYRALFHEAGHAEDYAHFPARLPLAYRRLGKSHARAELYSYLFEHWVHNPAWLAHYLKLTPDQTKTIRYQTVLTDLFMYRRYIAKFLYERELFKSDDFSQFGSVYAEKLTKATGFAYKTDNYLADLDGGFYAADYLRAWIGTAQLESYLKDKWGPNWFLQKKVGRFLKKLWSVGTKLELEEVITQLGVIPFDPTELERQYQEVLGEGVS